MMRSYQKDLRHLYGDIFQCLLRRKQPITVSVQGLMGIAMGEIGSIFKLPMLDDTRSVIRIEFPEHIKLTILKELQHSPLGTEIFGRKIGPNEKFYLNHLRKYKGYKVDNYVGGYVITWNNHYNNIVTCKKYSRENQLLYSFQMYVVVDIINQRTVIEVDWKTIKRLLPITGVRMSKRVLSLTKIDLISKKSFQLNRLRNNY